MRLRALEIEQLRKFHAPVRVSGLEDGLNLIAGPNEMGKSTLVTALWTVLFERHRANTSAVRSLQPNMVEGAAPRITLDFELEGQAYRIEKRFLRRPSAVLTLPDGQRVEGDAAEARLQQLLGLEVAGSGKTDVAAPGHWAVLWVAQTQSFVQATINPSARNALQLRLEAEFDALTGRAASDRMQSAIETSLYGLVDRRLGRPKGRYKDIEDRLTELATSIAAHEQAEQSIEGEAKELRALQKRLEERSAEQALAREEVELEQLQARRQTLAELAGSLREAEAGAKLARYELDRLETALHRRDHVVDQIASMRKGQAEATEAEAAAEQELARLLKATDEARRQISQISAQRAQLDRQHKLLCRLQRVIDQRDRCRSVLEAVATELQLELEPAAYGRVRLNGAPVTADLRALKLVEPVDIAIEGVGQIKLRPFLPDAERLRRQQSEAEQALTRLWLELRAAGSGDAQAVAPQEVSGQRIDVLIGRTEQRIDAIDSQSEAARRQLDQLHDQTQRQLGKQEQSRLRLEHCAQEVERLLEDQASLPTLDLATELGAAKRTLAAALRNREQLELQIGGDAVQELAELEQRQEQLLKTIEERTKAIHELHVAIEGLRTRVQLQAGEGVGERIDQARRQQAELEQQRALCVRDVAALGLLRDTLRAAEQDARDHYLRPIIDRIQPYLQILMPGAELMLDEEFHVTAIQRGNRSDEAFDQLSDGTKEQIAVLARLAFAEMLRDQGLPALVILDDALVFADDQRLRTMFKVLERAAEKLQILVLTCREHRFTELAAKPVRIETDIAAVPDDSKPLLTAAG